RCSALLGRVALTKLASAVGALIYFLPHSHFRSVVMLMRNNVLQRCGLYSAEWTFLCSTFPGKLLLKFQIFRTELCIFFSEIRILFFQLRFAWRHKGDVIERPND